MAETKVNTIGRLAQWRIESFGQVFEMKSSDTFKIGIWNWGLAVVKGRFFSIMLVLDSNRRPPLGRVVVRLTVADSNRRSHTSPTPTHEGPISCVSFKFDIDLSNQDRFVIDVEFLDLKISPSDGGEGIPVWPNGGTVQNLATRSSTKCLSHMLNESLFTDITINTSDGKLHAHRAVLSASSPVFHSMFVHDLKEKQSSTIDIEDMTSESCTALLGFIYGSIKQEDFWKHRLALLAAADKYSLPDLKDACDESLVDDINSENVLERLQEAWLYRLDKLMKGCKTYLVDFGKIYDLREDMNDFFETADRELVAEMFQEMLGHYEDVWFKLGEAEESSKEGNDSRKITRKRKRRKRNE